MDFSDRHSARIDPARLRAVKGSGLLGSAAEERLDRLTRLASESLNAAAAFVSIVDADADHYMSCFGFPADLERSREMKGETFCHFTLVADGVLAIEDARAHPTFREVPTVQSLGVVAYLGVPIRSEDDHVLGAFCVIDTRPRRWTAAEVDTAISLARVAVDHLLNRVPDTEVKSESEAFYDFLAPITYALFVRITGSEKVSCALLETFIVEKWRQYGESAWREASVQAKILREARLHALSEKKSGPVSSRPVELEALPDFITESQRRLLALAYFDGLTVKQISAVVATPEDDVRRDLLHAVQALRLARMQPRGDSTP